MSSLVIRYGLLLVRLKNLRFLLKTGNHSLYGLLKMLHLYRVVEISRGYQSGLVAHVGDVGSCILQSNMQQFTPLREFMFRREVGLSLRSTLSLRINTKIIGNMN